MQKERAQVLIDVQRLISRALQINLSEVSADLAYALQALEPTGEANPPPLFAIRNAQIASRQTVGEDGKHLKLRVTDGGPPVEAIAFRWGEASASLPDQVDLACHLEINEWNGKQRLQLNIQDIHPAE